MKLGYLYILECSDGSYYTGSTNNLELRLEQHHSGKGANHTKKRLPVKLVYVEKYDRVQDAFYREKQIQKWSRMKKEALIKKNFNELKKYAECQNESHFKNAAFDSAQAAPSNTTQAAPSNTAQAAPSNTAQAASSNTALIAPSNTAQAASSDVDN